MPINLQEIRTAVQTYLDTKVGVSISALLPDVPGTINPAEEFSFSVTATNATTANGGIRLVNVRYHLWVVSGSVAKLKVPPVATALARSGTSLSSPTLIPGALVDAMFLFPPDNSLDVGDSDTISGLKGKAGGAVGTTNIQFHIHADVDMNHLFPKDENSANATKAVNIV